jgi:hypothetical protein
MVLSNVMAQYFYSETDAKIRSTTRCSSPAISVGGPGTAAIVSTTHMRGVMESYGW